MKMKNLSNPIVWIIEFFTIFFSVMEFEVLISCRHNSLGWAFIKHVIYERGIDFELEFHLQWLPITKMFAFCHVLVMLLNFEYH